MKPGLQRAVVATERLLGAESNAIAHMRTLRALFAGEGLWSEALPLTRPIFGVRIVCAEVVTFHVARPEMVDYCLQSMRVSKSDRTPTRWLWYQRGRFCEVTDAEFLGHFLQGMGTESEIHHQANAIQRLAATSKAGGDRERAQRLERAVTQWWEARRLQSQAATLQRAFDWSWRIEHTETGVPRLEVVRGTDVIAHLTYEHFTEQIAQVIVAFMAHQDWPGIGKRIGTAAQTYQHLEQTAPDSRAYYATRHELLALERFYDNVRAVVVHAMNPPHAIQ